MKIIRKIAALGGGAAMLGATMTGALAADLADLPAPFVADSAYVDVAMVIGNTLDNDARTEIKTYMDSLATAASASEESDQFDKSSDFLELYQEMQDSKDVFTSSDLPTALSDFDVRGKTDTGVKQYLRFSGLTQSTDATATVGYLENNVDEQELFLYIDDSDYFFEYELEFASGYDSDNSSNDLEDWDNDVWNILGEEFIVVDADLSGTEITINLMGGAESDSIAEGETKSYVVEGSTYEVNLLYTSATQAKFVVNGESTSLLSEGDTYTLEDDTKIGVSDILYQAYSGGVHQADFYIGADSVDLVDDAYNDSSYNAGVTIGGDSIEDARVKIVGSATGNVFTLTNLKYQLIADGVGGDVYIGANEGIRSKLDEPEGMLGTNWDLTFKGLSEENTETIEFTPSGDDSYRFSFVNSAGNVYSNVELFDNSSAAKFGGDESDEDFWFTETAFINTTGHVNNTAVYMDAGDVFVVSDAVVGSSESTTETYILQYNSIDTSDNVITFSDVSTGGSDYEVAYGAAVVGDISDWTNYDATNSTGVTSFYHGDLIIGGTSYDVILNETSELLVVNLDSGSTGIASDEVGVVTQYGAIIDFGTQSSPSNLTGAAISVTLNTDDEMIDDVTSGYEITTIGFTFGLEVDLDVTSGNLTDEDGAGVYDGTAYMKADEDDSTHQIGYTVYGALVDLTEPSDDPATLSFEYPEEQRGPEVFVEYGSSETSTSAALMTASEVTDATTYNLILVGGPCVNSLTASFEGVSAGSCGADSGYSENTGYLKMFDNGEKVALVVAGWEVDDTKRAAKVVANPEAFTLAGTTATVTGDSLEVEGIVVA